LLGLIVACRSCQIAPELTARTDAPRCRVPQGRPEYTARGDNGGVSDSKSGMEPGGSDEELRILAHAMEITLEEARVFIAEQQQFGRIVGDLRDRYPTRFAHAAVRYNPPSFLVRFVGAVPEGIDQAFAELTYPVELCVDGTVSEAELRLLQNQIWELLMAEGITNHATVADTEHGQVAVTIRAGFTPTSETLREFLASPSVRVSETDEPVWRPQHEGVRHFGVCGW